MNVFQSIYERRSIRVYDTGKHIPEGVLLRILNSSRYILRIPTGEFPFRFVVVNDEETREIIAQSAKEFTFMLFGASFELFGPGHLWYLSEKTRLKVAEYTTTGELWTYPRNADLVLVPLYTRGAWVNTITNLSDQIDIFMQYTQAWPLRTCGWLGISTGLGPLTMACRFLTLGDVNRLPHNWGCPGHGNLQGRCVSAIPKGKGITGPARTSLDEVI